jgi:hypothetical protein
VASIVLTILKDALEDRHASEKNSSLKFTITFRYQSGSIRNRIRMRSLYTCYSFDSAFVASTKLFLPPKPKRYAATLRICISSPDTAGGVSIYARKDSVSNTRSHYGPG